MSWRLPAGGSGLIHGCSSHEKRSDSGYRSWCSMRARCLNVEDKDAKWYNHKGVKICKHLASSFQNFIAVIGPRPSRKYSVDRIDGTLHYSCGTCADCSNNGWTLNIRWATARTQQLNKPTTTKIVWNGKEEPLSYVCERFGADLEKTRQRVKRGWPINEDLFR